jgi:hypothetical protein
MSFKGSVESFSLADVFQNLSMNQQTGTLSIAATPGHEKNIFFKEGHVSFLAIGAQPPPLPAEVFLAHGLVQQRQADEALARHQQSKEGVVAALLSLGHLSRENHELMLKHQIEEEIYDLFTWEKASFEFNEGAPTLDKWSGKEPPQDHNLAVSHLIMEAARRVDEWERLRKHVPVFDVIYCLDAAATQTIESGQLELDPPEKHIAALLDASRDVTDLIANSNLFKFEVLTILAGFIESSLARPATLQELQAADQRCRQQNSPLRRINILERVLALGGENKRIREELAGLLSKAKETGRACNHLGTLAALALEAGNLENAIELYGRILVISPNNAPAHEQLAAIYLKRGQKREAFVHFLEVFEIEREQKQLAAACAAAQRALECDPARLDLRSNLVDLLAADNQRTLAGQQLEVLGDLAVKSGNVKLAADSYRRAFQFCPAQKQLKKKLADAMLSKEDRRLRKHKLLAAIGAAVLALLFAGLLIGKEYLNGVDYENAKNEAQRLVSEAKSLEESHNFAEAQNRYRAAQAAWNVLLNRFSPFMNYGDKAKEALVTLDADIAQLSHAEENLQLEAARRSSVDLEAGQAAWKSQEIVEAKKDFEKVLQNNLSSPENTQAAKAGLEAAQNLRQRLEEAGARLQKSQKDPNNDYENARMKPPLSPNYPRRPSGKRSCWKISRTTRSCWTCPRSICLCGWTPRLMTCRFFRMANSGAR